MKKLQPLVLLGVCPYHMLSLWCRCRCSDKTVVSTLEAINLVLGGLRFFAVLGIDKDIVVDAIQKEQDYKDVRKASGYLEKIVQVIAAINCPSCLPTIALVHASMCCVLPNGCSNPGC